MSERSLTAIIPIVRTSIYRVTMRGEVLHVAPTEPAAKAWMENRVARGTPSPGALIEGAEVDLPLVEGVITASEDGDAHVVWQCPACGTLHDTDISPADKSPGLWSCERKGLEHLFLVSFGSPRI